ncbi:macrolide ABC transporter permease [Spirosoma radiotolerans]|uniref:Macrolide ABC transporter permease n=2 Tax=Spirosoma radiotolerans TaxID=1379870 RepID=A0A0E4A0E9_9BACT|nr:macrolide ABC transporter permease [Spirosoma radiotolerans]
MIRNYFTVAWRNLVRNKAFSAINIIGLTTGMTCCMLLLLYIRSELSFDRHHEFADDLYLVNSEAINAGGHEVYPKLSASYAQALKAEYPEVMEATRLWVNIIEDRTLLTVDERGKPANSFYETKGYQVDSTFFDVFSYTFLEGDAKTALNDPHSVVLSEELAHKLFGNTPVLNKTIRVGGTTGFGENFKITGVYKGEQARSHIDARFFVPMSVGWVAAFIREQPATYTGNNLYYTYVRLKPGTDTEKFNRKLAAFMNKYVRQSLKKAGFDKRIFLVPVKNIHLYSQLANIVTATSSAKYLYILGSIALFTLLIACINFMNLSTARSAKRATEVGVRKVLGAGKQGLVGQFLGESMLLAIISLLIASLAVSLSLPAFNQLTGKSLATSELINPLTIIAFLILTLLTGLAAGSYPAFYLSVFKPVDVIKGRFTNQSSSLGLRRGLVVFQFVVAIGLVVATIVIRQQMNFLRDQPLGFVKDQQLVVPLHGSNYSAIKQEMLKNSRIAGVAGADYYPGITNQTNFSLYRPDQSVNEIQDVKTNRVSPEFMQVMRFSLVAGRLFSRDFPGDTASRIVVNEATLRKFAIPLKKAIGQKLNFDWQGTTNVYEIVGVVKDFHFADLHQSIQPYAFHLSLGNQFNYMVAHIQTTDMSDVLPFLENRWKTLVANEPFEYSFLNEDFQKNYQSDTRTSRIVNTFTIVSILISCLGLLGLAAFAAQQRTKEIGVRKVLGASVTNVVALLTKDFIKLVLLSIAIASPIAWYAMNQWLQSFAYKIDIEWWVFAVSGLLTLGIALLTVSFQSIKAALMNPVKSLRSE